MFAKSLRGITVISAVAFGAIVFTAAAASAQTEDVDPYVEIIDEDETPSEVSDDESPSSEDGDDVAIRSGSGGTLPFTGVEAGVLAVVGFGLLAGGTALVVGSRRQRNAA